MTQKDPSQFCDKEFPMTDKDFEFICELVYNTCGIVLGDHKREMVYSRLARRIRSIGLRDFKEYCELINQKNSPELSECINSITTNLTSFFRENHHFEFLENKALAEMKSRHSVDKRVRIWSAGCSSGEEPYSIAITLAKHFPTPWDFKVLATDLDSNMLYKAKNGIYAEDSVDGLPSEKMERGFVRSKANRQVKVKPGIQEHIQFKRLNLLQQWPMKGPFDVIFCRNVVIYFDQPTKVRLFERYWDMLADGGYLFLGHSESLSKDSPNFKSVGRTIYQKI
nr:protein-glutamate O-methyltransferase [Algicola sagamiensis]